MTLKHILDLVLRKVHCAQVVCQIKFNYIFISVSLELSVSKYVNRFEQCWASYSKNVIYYSLLVTRFKSNIVTLLVTFWQQ